VLASGPCAVVRGEKSVGRFAGLKVQERRCRLIATTVGWCSARTIGFIFSRTFSSGIESLLPRPTPSLLALPSKAASVSSAMTAAESISINPQKCSNTNRSFLTLSLRIRYFEIARGGGANLRSREISPRRNRAERRAAELGVEWGRCRVSRCRGGIRCRGGA
jgi:hypothetical protein